MNSKKTDWEENAKSHSEKLHSIIRINNEDWHIYRSNKKRRSAELISAAIVQLINNGNILEIIEKIEQSLLWLKEEIKDPGCSGH